MTNDPVGLVDVLLAGFLATGELASDSMIRTIGVWPSCDQ